MIQVFRSAREVDPITGEVREYTDLPENMAGFDGYRGKFLDVDLPYAFGPQDQGVGTDE